MKKLISVLLATVLLFVTAIGTNAATVGSNPLPEEGSGMCGKNMYWSRSDNGTLKIFGFGEMYDYHDGDNDILNIPWQKNDNSTAITEIIIEDGVQSICDFAFANTSISEIRLPNSVKSIGQYAFSHCDYLSDVVLSDNLEAIPEGAFMYDGMLENIYLPQGLKSIGTYAFNYCKNLKNVIIPKNVTEIGFFAFANNELIEDVVIPPKMTSITENAFYNCSGLKKMILSDGLKTIKEHAVSSCPNIEEIILPDTVTSIGAGAFAYKYYYRDKNLPKQKLYIPESVISIDNRAVGDETVIYGFKDSSAEKYAKAYGSEFVEVKESMYDKDKVSRETAAYYEKNNILSQLPDRDGIMEVISVNGQLNIRVGSKIVNFPDAKPFVDKNSRTQTPIRAVAETLGCTVDWNGESAVLTSPDDIKITLTPGSSIMKVNDTVTEMDSAAVISENRTYIPARFAAEAMSYSVKYKNLK